MFKHEITLRIRLIKNIQISIIYAPWQGTTPSNNFLPVSLSGIRIFTMADSGVTVLDPLELRSLPLKLAAIKISFHSISESVFPSLALQAKKDRTSLSSEKMKGRKWLKLAKDSRSKACVFHMLTGPLRRDGTLMWVTKDPGPIFNLSAVCGIITHRRPPNPKDAMACPGRGRKTLREL